MVLAAHAARPPVRPVARTKRNEGRPHGVRFPVRGHLAREGDEATLRTLHSGWACTVRLFADGRRQIVHLLLPGDLLTPFCLPGERVTHLVAALTPVTVMPNPQDGLDGDATARARGMARWHLHNQICRLGRQSAYERFAHLLIELRDRMRAAGQCPGDDFEMPLTQDMLADVLGLTSVHVNRTLQQLRRDQMIRLGERTVTLLDLDALARIGEYRPAPF